MTTNFTSTAAFIWSVADLLRGDFKQSQYGRIILSKLSISSKAYPVVNAAFKQLVSAYTASGHPFRSNEHGYVVLIEESDVIGVLDLPELELSLINMPWEGLYGLSLP